MVEFIVTAAVVLSAINVLVAWIFWPILFKEFKKDTQDSGQEDKKN